MKLANLSPGAKAAAAGAVLIGLLLLIYAAEALFLIFGGCLFGLFLRRLSMILSRRTPLSYGQSLASILIVLVGWLAATVLYAGPALVEQGGTLVQELNAAAQSLAERFSVPLEPAKGSAPEIVKDMVSDGKIVGIFTTAFSTALGGIVALLVIFFCGVYFAGDTATYRAGVLTYVPPENRLRAEHTIDRMGDDLWSWLLGRLASMAIIGIGTWGGLLLLGIPLAFPLAVITALLTFIPNIGPVLSVIPPTLLALQESQSTALMVVLFYLLLQIVESYILEPLIIQRSVSIPPIIAIASQLTLGMIVGIAGVMFSVPLIVALRVLVQESYLRQQAGGRDPQTVAVEPPAASGF